MKNILIICDSHGTKWGANGYAWQIKEKLFNENVTILEYGGMSLNKILDDIQLNKIDFKYYDTVIIGIGNPDIHPRIPKKIINFFKFWGLSFVRDSYFSIPPIINISYILRFPFFLFRLILIRFVNETYLDNKSFLKYMDSIIEYLQPKTKKIIILPLFYVNKFIYTDKHNKNAKELNTKLNKLYEDDFFKSNILKNHEYKKYYNYDGFHFKDVFHQKISRDLIKRIKD